MAANVNLPKLGDLPKDGDPYPEPTDEQTEIVNVLSGYYHEASNNRKGGLNPRDDKWEQNINLYWNRYDFSGKEHWQAKEAMPEVPGFVDRFAAAMKDALVGSPNDFYTVTDPYGVEDDISWAIKSMTDVWLSQAGRNQVGTVLDFSAVFEEQMKMGALMACSATVLWRNDIPKGRVSIESVDPREVWLDHTYRNLYRLRRVKLDVSDLIDMTKTVDSDGTPIFNLDSIAAALGDKRADRADTGVLTGSGTEQLSGRRGVTLDEYIATVVSKDGRVLAKDELMVVANDKYLIRGPEKNPYWHKRDWLVYAPLITAPLSVYGRTYMEDFGDLAKTFTELTNLILDATQTAAINAFAVVPSMLEDPTQAQGGIWPNKMFRLAEGYKAEEFARALTIGQMNPAVIQVWTTLKNELHEAAGINEVGMGQFAPKGRTSAAEVGAALNNSGAIIKSVAQTVETRFLNPILDLTWKTGVQHCKADDPLLKGAVGDPMWTALIENREELVKRPYSFQARGISMMIQRSRMLQSLMQLLQIIASNPDLMAAFMQQTDMQKLLDLLFNLSNINPQKLAVSERDMMVKSITQPMQQAAEGGTPSPPGLAAAGGAAQAAGIAKGGGY